jgi:hypothetical protein
LAARAADGCCGSPRTLRDGVFALLRFVSAGSRGS